MCVKLPLRDLNPNPCLPHPASTYIYGVTIILRVRGGKQTNSRDTNANSNSNMITTKET